MKKIFSGCLTIIVIFIVLGIVIGACSSDGGKDTTKDEPKTETNKQSDSKDEKKAVSKDTTKEKKSEVKKEKTYKIGDTVNVGKMQYKIKSISIAKQVGPSVLPTKASDQYVVIDVTVKNNGDKAVTVDANFFTLLKGDKKFETDSAASMSANQSEDGNIDNSFFLQQINPESKISGKVVFDVAESVAKSKDLKLQVQTGFWGTESEVITLKK